MRFFEAGIVISEDTSGSGKIKFDGRNGLIEKKPGAY
jgi:hypothetical protein